MPDIRRADTDDDLRRCWPVLRQLRPDLAAEALVPAVRAIEPHGFRVVYLQDDAGVVRAVAGYRVTAMLRTGPMLEVDDLVTDDGTRSHGYGKALFEWLVAEAQRLGCTVLELDSGVQRHSAHRFYFRQRMHILGYHFSLDCASATAGSTSS